MTRHNGTPSPAEDVDRSLDLFFALKSRSITGVSVRSRVCGVATVELLLQTAGVCRVPMNSLVCELGGLYSLKK